MNIKFINLYICDGKDTCSSCDACLKTCKYTVNRDHAVNDAILKSRLDKDDYNEFSLEFIRCFDFINQTIANGEKTIIYEERENKID